MSLRNGSILENGRTSEGETRTEWWKMKILVFLAGWAGDATPNTQRWLSWYKSILCREFSEDDIFFAISYNSDDSLQDALGDLPNIIAKKVVPESLHMNSDASQFQLCLRESKLILSNYDFAFFFHTKGISYDFDAFSPWRDSVEKTIFCRSAFEAFVSDRKSGLIAERGHMIQAMSSINQCARLAELCGIASPAFHYAAATTLYYVDCRTLNELVTKLPRQYLEENLLSLGESRFFFEGSIPSLLTMLGAEPWFIGGCVHEQGFNHNISFDALPAHNSAIVKAQHRKMLSEGNGYMQVPVPYVFAQLEKAIGMTISFEL